MRRHIGSWMILAAMMALLVSGCKKDPAKAKLEFVESAEKYIAEQKWNEAIIQYRNALKIDPTSSELQVSLAEAYMRNQQYREAFAAYKRAAELDPNNAKAQLALVRFYLIVKQPDEALQIVQKVREKDPNNLDAALLEASAFAGKNDRQQAMKIVEEQIAKHGDRPEPYMHKGMFLIAGGEMEKGKEMFDKVVSIDPKNVDAYRNIGTYYAAKKDYAKAEESYRKAVDLNPDSLQAKQMLLQFYMAATKDGKQSQPDKAEPVMKDIVKLSKNSDTSRMELGDFYKTIGRNDQAKAVFEQLAKDSPKFMPPRYALAQYAFDEKRIEDGDKIVADILKERPKDPQALILSGRSHIEHKEPEKAINDLEAALKLDPKLPMLHHLMGIAYEQTGNFDRAQASFEEAINQNQNFLLAKLALADLMLNRHNPDATLKYTDDILKVQNVAEAHLYAGNAWGQKNDLNKATAEFQKFIELAPNSPKGYVRLAYTAMLQKKFDVAEKNFKKALEISFKEFDAVEGLTSVYIQQNKAAQAETFIKNLIAQDGNVAGFYMVLGKFYLQQKRMPEAEAALNKAHNLDPQNTAALALLGTAYAGDKQIDKALAHYEQATRVNPKDAGLWTIYGMLNEQLGKYDVAQQAYEKALDIRPNEPSAANNLAWILARSGKDLDRALELARRAKVAMPDSPAVSDTLAWIYYKRQLFDSAAPLISDALKKQPENANYYWHYAAILDGQGKKNEAKNQLAKALQKRPELRNQDEVKQLMTRLSM